MDYRTEAHTILANVAYSILPNWNITADFAYTMGYGSMTDLDFDSKNFGDLKLDLDVSAVNPDMPKLYDVAYLSKIESYSDLDYDQIDFNVGTNFTMDNGIGIHFNYSLFYLDDDDQYVYGDQGNTVQLLTGFLSYSF